MGRWDITDKMFMKQVVRFFSFLIVAVGVMITLHSCSPDEIDAFADGYRAGYEGASSFYYDNVEDQNLENAETLK